MIDLGAGIAIGAISVSIAGVVITALKVRPQKGSETCSLHSGIASTLTFMKEQMERLECNLTTGLNTIHHDIKNILMNIGDKNDS